MKKDFSSLIESASPDEIDAVLQNDVEIGSNVSSEKIKKSVKSNMSAGKSAKIRTSLVTAASILIVAAVGVASVIYMVGQKKVDPPTDYTGVCETPSAATPAETTATATVPSEEVSSGATTEIVTTETTESTTATEHQPIYEIPTYEVRQDKGKPYFKIKRHTDGEISALTYIDNGEERWSVRISGFDGTYSGTFYMEFCTEISDGAIVVMKPYTSVSAIYNPTSSWYLAKVDFDGNVCWKKRITEVGYIECVEVKYIYEYDDGTFAVISGAADGYFGDAGVICFSHYSQDGERLSYKTTTLDYNFSICGVVRCDDGFIAADLGFFDYNPTLFGVKIRDYYTYEKRCVRLDDSGNVTPSFFIENPEIEGFTEYDEWDFLFTSVIGYNGKIYFSGLFWSPEPTGLSKEEKEWYAKYTYKNSELVDVQFKDLNVENAFGKAMRNKMIGFIVCCNYDGSDYEMIYCERGKQTGNMYVDCNGNLILEAEKIISFYYLTNNDPYIGLNRIYEYTFDPDGNLINVEETNRYKRTTT